MNEYGTLIEEITQVLGPLKRRAVSEVWRNENCETTAIVPRFSHFTLRGICGTQTLCKLAPLHGRVERR
jgi:hypothetical protein